MTQKCISLKKLWYLTQKYISETSSLNLNSLNEGLKLVRAQDKKENPLPCTINSELEATQLAVYLEQKLEIPVRDSDLMVISTEDTNTPRAEICSLKFALYNLRSGFNIGSIIRLADGLHASEVILSGYSAGPTNLQVKKSALGAESKIDIKKYENSSDMIQYLKSIDYNIVALETCETAISLTKFNLPEKTAILVGNERHGIPNEILNKADSLVKIPMYGYKNSLNVVSALSMASYEWAKQWR